MNLIVYGGRGKAARNFESLDLIIKALKDLENDETLLIQSGKPVGILQTHKMHHVFLFPIHNWCQIGQHGNILMSWKKRIDDVWANDRRLMDLYRQPGNCAGHL